MIQEIYIIDDTNNSIEKLKKVFKDEKDFRFKTVKTSNLEEALKNIPSLIIINEDNIDEDIKKICETIRTDEDNSITPVIVCSSINEYDFRNSIDKIMDQTKNVFYLDFFFFQ